MPKYLVIQSHGLGGGRFAAAGDVIELEQRAAEEKLRYGYIKPAPEKASGKGGDKDKDSGA